MKVIKPMSLPKKLQDEFNHANGQLGCNKYAIVGFHAPTAFAVAEDFWPEIQRLREALESVHNEGKTRSGKSAESRIAEQALKESKERFPNE